MEFKLLLQRNHIDLELIKSLDVEIICKTGLRRDDKKMDPMSPMKPNTKDVGKIYNVLLSTYIIC